MKTKCLLGVLLLIFTASCTSSHKTDFLNLFGASRMLKYDVFNINPSDIKMPANLSIVDSFLVVYNWKHSKSIFDVYSLNSQKKFYEYLAIGGGPCEVPSGIGMWRTSSPRSIEFDNNHRQMVNAFTIGQPFSTNTCILDTVLNYKDIAQVVFRVAQMNDSIFILSGLFKEGRIGVLNSKTKQFKVYFNYPDSVEVKMDNIAYKSTIFQGVPTFHPNGAKFALTGQDVFEIYEYKDNRLSLVRAYHGEMPKYRQTGDGGLAFLRDSKIGFTYGCSTENHVYQLYSPKTLADRTITTDCLLVFDWDGNPIQRYQLAAPVLSIFTNDDKTLYAVAEVGDDVRIVTFDLGDLDRK